jgi:competence protein ComEA
MDPSAPTPWRVLETPSAEDDQRPGAGGLPQPGARPPDAAPKLPRVVLIGAAAIACALGAFVLATGSGSGDVRIEGGSAIGAAPSGSARSSGLASGQAVTGELIVEVVGAVRQPGVYRLPAGSRVGDVVQAAGGYGPRVDTRRAEQELNLAAGLSDGDQVRVPSRDDTGTAESQGSGSTGNGNAASPGATTKVDVNRATQAELEALPGIGPATAQKIITAREEAPFAAVDELRSRGILGEKTFEKLRELVTVG